VPARRTDPSARALWPAIALRPVQQGNGVQLTLQRLLA
jgi:hypothetical protein